ncbi:hypothetical protein [Sphingomonas sp. URHD0057]|uniref:hypothetical protein n=1 Tax=Sphingomonas sp. URHD0057 TaxID=1380389 RepID=UPI00048CE770|nr:hypothetical protein [Sphingomonas sp. URHD0057]
MPEWLIERGIGETRAVLVDSGEIIEARIMLDGVIAAGSIVPARLASLGTDGLNAIAVGDGGIEFLLPRGAPGVTQGASLTIEVIREAIPGGEPWKRPLARVSNDTPRPGPAFEPDALELQFPAPTDRLGGWGDLVDEARTGITSFAGGELRISPTPAMTLIDVDGTLAPDELAVLGASQAARAIQRLDIGGSIGIDLPTSKSRTARQRAAEAIDAILPQPFERTAVNGFGFVQIVRPRRRASLLELAQDRAAFEARALLRRASFEPAGPKTLVAHPAVVAVLEGKREWLDALARQCGGAIGLRADPSLTISGGYATSN